MVDLWFEGGLVRGGREGGPREGLTWPEIPPLSKVRIRSTGPHFWRCFSSSCWIGIGFHHVEGSSWISLERHKKKKKTEEARSATNPPLSEAKAPKTSPQIKHITPLPVDSQFLTAPFEFQPPHFPESIMISRRHDQNGPFVSECGRSSVQ